MKLITTFLLVCKFLLIIFLNNSFAQEFKNIDSLIEIKKYDDARIACEYLAFSNQENVEFAARFLLKKTEILKLQNKADEIPQALRRINLSNINDTLKSYIYYENFLYYFNSNNISKAEENILLILSLNTEKKLSKSSTIFYSLLLNNKQNWIQSKSNMLFYINNLELDITTKNHLIDTINKMYNNNKFPKIKSVKKARLLSTIFPGMGQIYNGNYGKAFMSLTLIGMSGLLVYYNFSNEAYLSGILSGNALLPLFYFGNVNQMRNLVETKNKRKANSFNNKLNKNLLYIYEKTKHID